jgi:hypothetical protein
MHIETYQRRPLYVEAVQINNENIYDIAKWCEGDLRTQRQSGKKFIQLTVIGPKEPMQMRAAVGSWILKSDQGFKIFSDQAFKKGWEKIGNVGMALQDAFVGMENPYAKKEETV